MRITLVVIAAVLGTALALNAQEKKDTYKKKTAHALEVLVGPVALYSDHLLGEVLDASQYPSDLVKAGDYMHRSEAERGKIPEWPKAIQNMMAYPNVVFDLDKHLSWSTRLGNAYEHQKDDLMQAAQRVRSKAQKAGNLVSNPYQTVTEQDGKITITSSDPSDIWVPHYSYYSIYHHHPAGSPAVTYHKGKMDIEESHAAHARRAASQPGAYAYPQAINTYHYNQSGYRAAPQSNQQFQYANQWGHGAPDSWRYGYAEPHYGGSR